MGTEEIAVAVVEHVHQFNEHVVWGRGRLMFVMVLRYPVVPHSCFGIVCVGDCAHVGFVRMERVRRMGAVVWMVRGRGVAQWLLLIIVGVHGLTIKKSLPSSLHLFYY